MMMPRKIRPALGAVAALAACAGEANNGDKTLDYKPFGASSLTDLHAGIWVDPRGCDHWIIDDGIEGYLSQRLDPLGKPVCSGVAPPKYVVGPFKGGQDVQDTI